MWRRDVWVGNLKKRSVSLLPLYEDGEWFENTTLLPELRDVSLRVLKQMSLLQPTWNLTF